MEVADFSGYATKNDLKCSDGRTIRAGAFKHQAGTKVPLVWQHQHKEPSNVLGYAMLQDRKDGVYTQAFFNDSPAGQNAKLLVEHGDVESLSIFANNLVQKGADVMHGNILEVSLVLSGANPGALIDTVNLAHSADNDDEEAIIYTGEEILHGEDLEESEEDDDETEGDEEEEEGDEVGNKLQHATATASATDSDKTIQEVVDSMNADQKQVLQYLVGEALSEDQQDNSKTAQHGNIIKVDDKLVHSAYQEGFNMARNVFETQAKKNGAQERERPTLSHDQLQTILDDGPKYGSLKESFLEHAAEYGIDDINLLFPDATLDSNGITYVSRRMEWVQTVLSGTKHSPFSRIKSLSADITADEARAKGYVKGNLKKDEVIKMLRRITTPKTIYKKQKLDRDDILDITEVDILAWIQAEMRVMLDEEIARAILVGDNRESDDEDKIDEDSIRPIAYDIDMYNTTVPLEANVAPADADFIDNLVRGLNNYRGSGTPTMFTTQYWLTGMLLSKDTLGRRFYATAVELAAAIGVSAIVPCEALEADSDIVAVVVNLQDYTVGADAGGQINLFDFFDIDYNQQKYLLETRISGALIKPKSAVTFTRPSGNVVTPTAPTFVTSTGVLTVPTQTGTVYTDAATGTTLAAGAQTAIAAGATVEVEAVPAAGYGFTHDAVTDWTFTRDAS
jgi:HK97 family phage prohead protease